MATGYSDLEVYHGTAATGPIPVQEEKIFLRKSPPRDKHLRIPMTQIRHHGAPETVCAASGSRAGEPFFSPSSYLFYWPLQ